MRTPDPNAVSKPLTRPAAYIAPMPLRGRPSGAHPHGLPLVNLGFNELPYPPLPSVMDAMIEAARAANHYGTPSCDALRDALGTAHGIDPEHIICGNGSEELLDVIARCFVRPGDEIVISAYGYIQFALTANRLGADLVKAPEQDLTTDPDALFRALTPRSKLIFLANPNNPTGTMLDLAALAHMLARVPPHVTLVLDLAYGEFAPEGYCAGVHSLARQYENVVITRTFSKAYGLAGARVGWCHAPAWMVPVIYGARAMGPVSRVAQQGAQAALAEQDALARRIAEICAERARLSGALRQLGLQVCESHANFVMLRPPPGSAITSETLVEQLYLRGGIIINRTREAGLEEYCRISLGLPEHNSAVIDLLRDIMQGA